MARQAAPGQPAAPPAEAPRLPADPATAPEAERDRELAELLDKYERLLALRRAPAGRTEARREAMRDLSRRHPGALREWDALPEGELLRRRDVLRQALAADDAPPAAQEPWLPFSLELHGRLRAILRQRREGARGAERPRGRPSELALGEVARRHGVTVEAVKRALYHPGPLPAAQPGPHPGPLPAALPGAPGEG